MPQPLSCFACGLARNCADTLSESLASLARLSSSFQRVEIVAVTNDSTDATAEILSNWGATCPNATVLRLDGLAAAIIGRTDRLAMLRNICLLELRRRIEVGRRFDLTIIFDLDGVNKNVTFGDNFSDLLSCMPPDWGGMFPNQRQAYFDVWALRHPRWCTEDCWQQFFQSTRFARTRFIPEPVRRRVLSAAAAQYIGRRQVRIDPAHAPIEVDSAFGGIGIYKTCLLDNAWYSGRDNAGREVCEHVPFNLSLRRAGAKLYIMPGLLNDAQHLAPGSGDGGRPWE